MLFALAIMLVAPAAFAGESESETVELGYRVPEGCPNKAAFVSAVTARATRARVVDRAPGARRFIVDIRRAGASYVGRLVVEQGTDRATREVTSARCEGVVEAFVLFTALAIDPAASLAPPPPSSSPPSASPPPPSSPPSPSPSPPPAPHRALVAAPPEPPAKASWRLSVGSGGFVATGIAEAAMVAAHPVVDLASSETGLSPSVRLGVAWANGASQPVHPGGLTLGLRALVLSGCGLHMHVGGTAAAVRLCALLEGGVLAVRPFGIANPTSPDRPWFAAGPLVRFELPVLSKLAVGCDAGVAIPFERERVFVRPGPTVALVDPVGLRFAVVVLLHGF